MTTLWTFKHNAKLAAQITMRGTVANYVVQGGGVTV
jgi:hypothetical protein